MKTAKAVVALHENIHVSIDVLLFVLDDCWT